MKQAARYPLPSSVFHQNGRHKNTHDMIKFQKSSVPEYGKIYPMTPHVDKIKEVRSTILATPKQ